MSFIIIIRLSSAIWNTISDCDEVYNYWEPAHYLVYNKGFQTWEYSPFYAIRSYFYIILHTLPIRLVNTLVTENKIIQFYVVRIVLALACSSCEIYFYKGVSKQFGINTNRITQWFSLFSAGMFVATPAFLPSSFSMYLTFLSMGAWFNGNIKVAILATAASAIIGWPFVGVLGLPIALDIIIRQKKLLVFIGWSLISLIVFLVPMVIIDSQYYGKLVIAPLNIVLYNVFSPHGPDLYGVEPVSYYVINGFLNFNVVFLAALVSLPVVVSIHFIIYYFMIQLISVSEIPVPLALSPMYLWLLIFFSTPHKEERFLFPIYPFFALAGALCVDQIQVRLFLSIRYSSLRLYCSIFSKGSGMKYSEYSNWIPLSIGCVFTLLSAFRILALYQGYHGSMDIYMQLNRISKDNKIHTMSFNKVVNICVGKEWYRFPSSFFLPDKNWHLRFLKSDFGGQLPKEYDSSINGTKIIPTDMNDMNLEEESRYFDVKKCHYIIDLDLSSVSPDHQYTGSYHWKTLLSIPFLDSTRSHRFFRAFYIPNLSRKYCTYVDYNLLQFTKLSKLSH
ncbi:hypothetical protein LOTGIDRAFT_114104 [Lottia gigantea]|uniref:Mannosyltransferase n=1 Tax=Lottia gigantea TaxID=225164 RepID=V4CAC4_LOTGI|nr:hypothetical protein LOTGIDRAFT_114104 [Lottia gigantea]ESO98754.1 hypothetical protein LOTGIDRAFT_114104 [Lottia gigantea]